MKLEPIPSSVMPIADRAGIITMQWLRWLGQFVAQPGPIIMVDVTASPMSYTASERGALAISGGTVSSIELTRTTTSSRTNTTSTSQTGITGGVVPMANGDIVTVVYTVAPTLTFIPG